MWLCCDPRKVLQMRLESGPMEGPDDEAIEVYRGTGGGDFARAGGGDCDG